MARPQLLLLLLTLLSLVNGEETFAESMKLVCRGHAQPDFAVQAKWCPTPPCTLSAKDLTLGLPVLLTLYGWSSELWLFNAMGQGSGVARLRLHEANMSLEAASCIGGWHTTYATCATTGPMRAVHMKVVADRKIVTLTLLPYQDSLDRPVTLHYQTSPGLQPSVVMVLQSQRFGYSAVTPVLQLDETAALVRAVTILTTICVVVGVAMLVLVWRVLPTVVAVHVNANLQH